MEYVTLFSNSSSDYLQNTPTHFKVKLPKKLKLGENYEVGVCEIHYNKSWFNIENDEEITVFFYRMNKLESVKCIFPKGYYDIDKLCEGINTIVEDNCAIYEFNRDPEVVYNEQLDRIQIYAGNDHNRLVLPVFSNNINQVIGIDENKYEFFVARKMIFYENETKLLREELKDNTVDYEPEKEEEGIYDAHKSYNLSGGYHSLYLYTDIIKPTYVGDSFTQLLKVLEIPSNVDFGGNVSLKYPNVQYFPLQINEIDAIEIKITDDTGELINFLGDSLTIVKLCFKKS